MNDNAHPTLPDSFIEQVKQALEHLYDFPYLQRHPLAVDSPAQAGQGNTQEAGGHRLRRELIAAIETLNPGNAVAVRSGVGRVFHLLQLHYVGGMTLQETALELGISPRQAYRDLRRGQESLSEILWFNRHGALNTPADSPADSTDPHSIQSIQSEVARLEGELKPVNISGLLASALKAVERLAERHGNTFEILLPEGAVIVPTVQMVAQQILISVLSHTVQQLHGQMIRVTLVDSPAAQVTVCYAMPAQISDPTRDPVIHRLLKQIGWHAGLNTPSEDEVRISVRMGGGDQATVLIVDDNEGLIDLLERYLTGQKYQVISATSGADGLRMAQELAPSVIIMDLMMPGMDGWELLQRLRVEPATRHVPVVICSVINDPELAYSLGASVFLSKPVGKDQLLNALQTLGI